MKVIISEITKIRLHSIAFLPHTIALMKARNGTWRWYIRYIDHSHRLKTLALSYRGAINWSFELASYVWYYLTLLTIFCTS